MIYSNDIEKLCGLCVYFNAGYCAKLKKNTAETTAACKKYSYDILKRKFRRGRRLKTDFSADDFKL